MPEKFDFSKIENSAVAPASVPPSLRDTEGRGETVAGKEAMADKPAVAEAMADRQKKFENLPEKEKISAETITADALKNIIYKGESLPQDNRFLSFKKGGAFKYFEIDDLFNNKENKFYPFIKESQKIVGLSELEKNPYEENVMWIKFISIDPEYQERGYASKLSEEIFRFAKEKGISLETSSYSPEGYRKLKKIFKRLSEKYLVNFIDKEAVL